MGLLVLSLFSLLWGLSSAQDFPWYNWNLSRDARAEALVKAMTTEEKIAQLVNTAPAIPRLRVPAYNWRSNVLHGLVDNGVSTQFPQATGMAATFSPRHIYAAASVMSTEQRAKHNIAVRGTGGDTPMDYGLNLWGPNINMYRDPRWGRGQETYGEDPFLTGELSRAFVQGLQNATGGMYKTTATCKHWVAYSVDNEPPRLEFDPTIAEYDLQQYYFPAWGKCASEAVAVMCAYNGVNGYPMCMSPLIKSHLRQLYTRPEQYVVSDSGAIEFMVSRFHRFNSTVDAAVAAMDAGVDLNSGDSYSHLTEAVAQKRVSVSQLDVALKRLFLSRIALGMFDPTSRDPYRTLGEKDIASEKNLAVALEVSDRSVVMLKNNGLLPLQADKIHSVAVIGWGANDSYALLGNYYGCSFGSWGPVLQNCSIVTPLDGVKRAFPEAEVVYVKGVDVESNDTSEFDEAVAAARRSDVVVYFGGNRNCQGGQGKGGAHCESEGHDRPDLEMPGKQTDLLKLLVKANPKTVLVALTGGPISMNWEAENLPAILVMWYGGTKAGESVGRVLNGKVSPSGRLPMTWVTGVDQLPDMLDMSPSTPPGRTYRYLNDTPLYSFGYGLSYGAFTYLNASVSPPRLPADAAGVTTVCVSVRNEGATSEDVVQVYAKFPSQTMGPSIPKQIFVGVQRSDPIRHGETAKVCADLRLADLQAVDNDGRFGVMPGKYRLYVGGTPPGPLGKYVPSDAVTPPMELELSLV